MCSYWIAHYFLHFNLSAVINTDTDRFADSYWPIKSSLTIGQLAVTYINLLEKLYEVNGKW